MAKCDIEAHLILDEDNENRGIQVKVDAEEVTMLDRFLIIHSIAIALGLDKNDLMIYSVAESIDLFANVGKEVRIDLNALRGLGYEG